MLCLPEIRLKRICDTLFQFIIDDYNKCIEEGKENNSYLYLLFHEDENVNVDSSLYKQAVQIFINNQKDLSINNRKIEVFPIFNRERANLPSVHITCPQDSDIFRQIGDEDGEQGIYNERGSVRLSRGFQSQFGIIVTSDNILEVICICSVLRALLIASIPDLNQLGFINPSFSLQELNVRPDVLPANVYMKGLIMNAIYLDEFPDLQTHTKFGNIIFILEKIKY